MRKSVNCLPWKSHEQDQWQPLAGVNLIPSNLTNWLTELGKNLGKAKEQKMKIKSSHLQKVGVLLSTSGVLASLIFSSVDVVSAHSIEQSSREDCIQALQMINSMQLHGCSDPALIDLRKDALQELEKLDFHSGQLETLKIKPMN